MLGDWLGVWAPPEGILPPRESTTLETLIAILVEIPEEIPSGWGVCICCTCKEAEDEGAGGDSKEEAEEAEAGTALLNSVMPITRTLTPPTMPICPRTFAKLGADSIGKLDVTIENQHQQGGVTMYSIRVAGPTGSHVVERRYKDVEQLRHMMLAQTPQAQVVQMPPKSFFRKNFSRNFMEERKRLLGEVVVACTAAADRYTDSCPPILYEFLGFSDFDDSAMETPSRATETDAMNVADIGEVQVSPRGSPTNTTEAEDNFIIEFSEDWGIILQNQMEGKNSEDYTVLDKNDDVIDLFIGDTPAPDKFPLKFIFKGNVTHLVH